MKYSTILKKLQKFNKIIVSGPQRSGTTIATEIIAYDLGLTAIREDFLDQLGTRINSDHLQLWLDTIQNRHHFTLQCPKMSHYLHHLAKQKDVAVIFMARDLSDIISSQTRISQQSAPGWQQLKEPEYKSYYKELVHAEDIDFRPDWNQPAAQIKYEFWHQFQKPQLQHPYDLDYDSLKHHPLWVNQSQRGQFHHRQTTLTGQHIQQQEINFGPQSNINPQYYIPGTHHLAPPDRYRDPKTYPQFQIHLKKFQRQLKQQVKSKAAKTYLKFSDGDYYFLTGQQIGTTIQGHTSLLKKSLNQIDLAPHQKGPLQNDYICVPIDPAKRQMWQELYPDRPIDFPADYLYALTANRWFTQSFAGQIGLIGAKEKLQLIQKLLTFPEYQPYLGLNDFTDYIHLPQRGTADNLASTKKTLAKQLKQAKSAVFLVGFGHVKCALFHQLKQLHPAVYLDVGAGIDALAGIINQRRPYSGRWVNHLISNHDYSSIHFDNYNQLGLGPTKYLNPQPAVIIGPWIGEFSYEISWWIPQIRQMILQQFPHHYRIAVGFPGRQALYRDFVDKYIPYPKNLQKLITYPSMHANLQDGQHQIPPPITQFFHHQIDQHKHFYPQMAAAQPNQNLSELRTLHQPGGEFRHLDTLPKFHRAIKQKLHQLPKNKPTIAVNAYWRDRLGFAGDAPAKTWDPQHWSTLIQQLISQLDANIVLFGVPHHHQYPGSLTLTQLPGLDTHQNRILDLVDSKHNTLDHQIALLKNTQASIWGATGAVTLAFFTNTPVFTHQAKEYGWRLQFQWQKDLTNHHQHVRIFDKYSVDNLYTSPPQEVFTDFKKLWRQLT